MGRESSCTLLKVEESNLTAWEYFKHYVCYKDEVKNNFYHFTDNTENAETVLFSKADLLEMADNLKEIAEQL